MKSGSSRSHRRPSVRSRPRASRIVSLDREKNDVTPRRIRQSVGTPFAHEPRGKRRMIRLCDEQLAISVRPDNHRLALARGSEDEQFIVVRAASGTQKARAPSSSKACGVNGSLEIEHFVDSHSHRCAA